MSPFVALTLTAFGGVLVLALLVWSLLSPRRRPPPPEATAEEPMPEPRKAPIVSNDEVRGARVRPPDRPKADDPFEQFLRAERDDR